MLRLFLLFSAALVFLANGQQTVSITDASGNVIVGVVTTPAVGAAPVTSFIATIAPTTSPGAAPATSIPETSTTTTPAAITQPTIQQGPVGQPASTSVTPGAPIPYIYTTVVDGATTVIQDTFTPTSPSTVSVAVTGTGSIMAFSDFTSLFGPPASGAIPLLRSPSKLVLLASSAILLLVGILCI